MTVPVAPTTVTTTFGVTDGTTTLATATVTDLRWPGIEEFSITCPAVTLPAGRWLITTMFSTTPPGTLPVTNQTDTTIGVGGPIAVPSAVADVLRDLDGQARTAHVAVAIHRRVGSAWEAFAYGQATITVPAAPVATAALRYGSSVNLVTDPDTGVAPAFTTANATKMRPYLDAIVAAGADTVRTGFGWGFFQPSSGGGVIDATAGACVDQFYTDCANRGLDVVAIIGGVPVWAGGKPGASNPSLADLDQWVNAYLARWSPVAIEFDNEPNIGFGYGSVVAASATARVMREVYLRAKAAAQPPLVGLNMAFGDAAYLQGVYNAAVGTCFDYVSIHPYYIATLDINDITTFYTEDPANPWVHDDVSNFTYGGHGQGHWVQAATAIYRTMRANGDAAKPVWVTEGGWSSSQEIPGADHLRCSEAQQADYTALALRQVARCPFVETVLTYSAYDDPNPRTSWTAWGMTRTEPDAEHKPLWTAWRDAVAGIKAGTL